jgi:hypothetical protein
VQLGVRADRFDDSNTDEELGSTAIFADDGNRPTVRGSGTSIGKGPRIHRG